MTRYATVDETTWPVVDVGGDENYRSVERNAIKNGSSFQ
jgi:hypothetical protein